MLIAWVASPRVGMHPLPTFGVLVATLVVTFGLLGSFVAPRELRKMQPVPALAAAARRVVAPDEPFAVAGNYGAPGLVFYSRHPVRQLTDRADLIAFLSASGRRHCVMPESELRAVTPLLDRRLYVQAQASVFSVRMKRLLENEPERAGRVLVLVTAE